MRKFGVEVEYGGSTTNALTALRAAGLTNHERIASYVGHDERYWSIKTDASVHGGGEMVSPPLDFDTAADREQVTSAINALRDSGATTLEAAGIHVHVDASDLTAEQVAAVVRCFTKFEDVIYRIASSGWTAIRPGAAQYAKPLPFDRVQKMAKSKTMDQLMCAWYGYDAEYLSGAQRAARNHGDSSRYVGLNLHSYFYRRTIEFRVFNSSLNPERVQAYIAMCVALVEDARRGNRRSINKRYALGGMAGGTTKDANAFHRFQQVLRYEAGMGLDDMKRLTRVWKDSRPQVLSNDAW